MPDGRDAGRLAIVLHEVRSPVAALAVIAESVGEAGVDLQARTELVRLVLAACRGIERIVTDLAPASVRVERVDVAALIADAVAAARLRGLAVETAIDGDVLVAEADPLRLRQVFDNLLTNAQTHAGGAGVRVSVAERGDTVTITVADQGPGIPDSERERILEPGVQLDTSTPGSGLGLAVTRALVVAHRGRLDVTSTGGGGATFIVELPAGPLR
jgi:signal transduction histidine kinase